MLRWFCIVSTLTKYYSFGRLSHQPSYCRRVTSRVSHTSRVSASSKEGMVTDSGYFEKQVQQEVAGRASFRFMAEGNMWLLEFEASGLRVLADPWLVDDQTFWDQAWLYTGTHPFIGFESWSIAFYYNRSSFFILNGNQCDLAGRSQSRLKNGLPGDLTMESVNSVDAILICQVCFYMKSWTRVGVFISGVLKGWNLPDSQCQQISLHW